MVWHYLRREPGGTAAAPSFTANELISIPVPPPGPREKGTMRKVWICQCLCPDRHCMVAVAGEADGEAAAKAELEPMLSRQVSHLLASGETDPWCGICRIPASQWRFETAMTKFATMAEATGPLRESQDNQRATAELWKMMFDVPPRYH